MGVILWALIGGQGMVVAAGHEGNDGMGATDPVWERRGEKVARLLLKRLKDHSPQEIREIRLRYDLYLQREWRVKLKMSAILVMKKRGNGCLATFRLTSPVGENLWGKFAMLVYGRHTREYQRMLDSIKTTIQERLCMKGGRFVTKELWEIPPETRKDRSYRGARILFDAREKQVKFWKNRSRKNFTTAGAYVNQVGPLTGCFNYLFFEKPETEIRTVNMKTSRGKTGEGGPSFQGGRARNGILGTELIRLKRNDTGAYPGYANVVQFQTQDFFDIVYGNCIYYNMTHVKSGNLKLPYSLHVPGIIDNAKKRKREQRRMRLEQRRAKEPNRRDFSREEAAIQSMDILSAKNVKAYLGEATVAYAGNPSDNPSQGQPLSGWPSGCETAR
jgi:hypothetical protein